MSESHRPYRGSLNAGARKVVIPPAKAKAERMSFGVYRESFIFILAERNDVVQNAL